MSHYILYEKNKKRWNTHDQLLKNSRMQQDLKEPEWLQIRASNWGLCNLLSPDKMEEVNPTLKHSPGLQNLMEKRKTAVEAYLRGSSEALFDDVDSKPAIKKRKSSRASSSTYQPSAVPHCLDLDLGIGTLIVMWPARSTDDLHIKYNAEQVQLFLDYMMEAGVQLEGQRRPYIKKHA